MSIAEVESQILTAEQFAQLPDTGVPLELVRGRLVEMNPPGLRHGRVCLQVGHILQSFLDANDLGRATGNDSGVVTQRGPDTVRGADVSYYSYGRLPKDQPFPRGYHQLPPDLVFEVLSPSDRWSQALTKVAEYLNAGVAAVCVVDAEEQIVFKFWPDRVQERLAADDVFALPEILPGFSTPVSRFFT